MQYISYRLESPTIPLVMLYEATVQHLLWLLLFFSHLSDSKWLMSDSLRPHGLQHARPPCTSPTPRAHSNSCPLSQRCHPTISSSAVPFSSCPQSFPASGSFPISQLFASGGQCIEVSASPSVLSMNIQDWFPLGVTGLISLQSKGLSRVFASTTVWKHQFFSTQPSLASVWALKTRINSTGFVLRLKAASVNKDRPFPLRALPEKIIYPMETSRSRAWNNTLTLFADISSIKLMFSGPIHQPPNQSLRFSACWWLEHRAAGPWKKATFHFASNHGNKQRQAATPRLVGGEALMMEAGRSRILHKHRRSLCNLWTGFIPHFFKFDFFFFYRPYFL